MQTVDIGSSGYSINSKLIFQVVKATMHVPLFDHKTHETPAIDIYKVIWVLFIFVLSLFQNTCIEIFVSLYVFHSLINNAKIRYNDQFTTIQRIKIIMQDCETRESSRVSAKNSIPFMTHGVLSFFKF